MLLLLFRSDDVEGKSQAVVQAVAMDALARERFVGSSGAGFGDIVQVANDLTGGIGQSSDGVAPWWHHHGFFHDTY